MKIKVVKTGKTNDENSKRGKRAKRKGGQYERTIAKKFKEAYGIELKRTPQSGFYPFLSSAIYKNQSAY